MLSSPTLYNKLTQLKTQSQLPLLHFWQQKPNCYHYMKQTYNHNLKLFYNVLKTWEIKGRHNQKATSWFNNRKWSWQHLVILQREKMHLSKHEKWHKMSVNPMYEQSPEGRNRRALICFSSEDTVWIWGIQHIQAACSNNPPVQILLVLQKGKKQPCAAWEPRTACSWHQGNKFFSCPHIAWRRETNKISKTKLGGIRTFLPILSQLMKIKGFYFFLKK